MGTPPFLRYRHPAFVTASTPSGREAGRVWRELVSEHESGLDTVALDLAGVDIDSLGHAFGAAELESDSAAPDWIRCLALAVGHFSVEPVRHSPSEDSIEVAAGSFSDAASALLGWNVLVDQHEFLDERGLAAFSRHLATRVVMSCAAVLELETMHTNEVQWDFTRSAWRERLLGFPGLNYVMGTAIRQWRLNALELIDRLDHDLPEIRARLLAGASTGAVTNIEFDLGDRHHDGRSVAVVTFESGNSVVYKPKDLRCARTFLDVIAIMNDIAGRSLLGSFRILPRADYSWEEYVPQNAVGGRDGAARFFERYGALLRLVQLLEGRDFWIDNLRVSSGFPVFVDLECIFQPHIEGMGFVVQSPDFDRDLFDSSVLPTAAVTQAMDVEGFGRQDFGGLSGNGIRALPLGLWSGYRDRDNGNILLRNGRLFWAPDVAWPQVEGRSAAAEDFLAELDSGYRSSHSVLARSAHRLRAEDGPFRDLADLKVRALLRSTWEYLMLLRASLDPTALLSGVARENVLARVLSSAPAWGDRQRVRQRMRIAWSEVESLRNLDVPEFLSHPSSTVVSDMDGNSLGEIFSGRAQDRLRERLTDIDDFEIASHAQILRIGVQLINALASSS